MALIACHPIRSVDYVVACEKISVLLAGRCQSNAYMTKSEYRKYFTAPNHPTSYLHFNGQRIAMEQVGVLHYLFTNHLGCASVSYRAGR